MDKRTAVRFGYQLFSSSSVGEPIVSVPNITIIAYVDTLYAQINIERQPIKLHSVAHECTNTAEAIWVNGVLLFTQRLKDIIRQYLSHKTGRRSQLI